MKNLIVVFLCLISSLSYASDIEENLAIALSETPCENGREHMRIPIERRTPRPGDLNRFGDHYIGQTLQNDIVSVEKKNNKIDIVLYTCHDQETLDLRYFQTMKEPYFLDNYTGCEIDELVIDIMAKDQISGYHYLFAVYPLGYSQETALCPETGQYFNLNNSEIDKDSGEVHGTVDGSNVLSN